MAQSQLPTLPDLPICKWKEGEAGLCTVTNTNDSNGAIHLNFFARLLKDDFSSKEEILERFFDFDRWKDYAQGNRYPKFLFSKTLPDLIVDRANGQQTLKRNQLKYISDAPFPLPEQTIHESSIFEQIPSWEGAYASWKFELDKDFDQLEGLRFKSGSFHTQETEEYYYIYYMFDVTLSFNVLTSLAAPFIKDAVEAIFRGMFDFVQ